MFAPAARTGVGAGASGTGAAGVAAHLDRHGRIFADCGTAGSISLMMQ